MNNPLTKKSYGSIVAPLKKMMNDLNAYVKEQQVKISKLNAQKRKINDDINLSETEILKSEGTATKLSELLSPDSK